MKVPLPEDLDILNGQQQAYAKELVDILNEADETTFYPNWEARPALISQLMSRYRGIYLGETICAAICELRGVEDSEQARVRNKFEDTLLYYDLCLLDGFTHNTQEDFFDDWAKSVAAAPGIERAVHAANPHFITELYMLGVEYKFSSIAHILGKISINGLVSADIAIFIGESENDPEKLGWEPEEQLGQLEREAMRYLRVRSRDVRPIEPETLIGTVASGMHTIGWI